MQKILLLVITFIIVLSSQAANSWASERIGTIPEGMCTRDFNPWGHASHCKCDEGSVYDERAGLCLSGDKANEILLQGVVSSDSAAIGGETTGFLIETAENENFELILTIEDQDKLRKISGMWLEIRGEPLVLITPEMGKHRVIIVDNISVLE